MLTAEEYNFVLYEKCPLKSDDQYSNDDKLAYQKWQKADEMAQCYVMASVSNVLQHQYQICILLLRFWRVSNKSLVTRVVQLSRPP